LRFDRDEERNKIIRAERLTPEEVVRLEKADGNRYNCLQKNWDTLILDKRKQSTDNRIFFCGAGKQSCVIGWDGYFRLCESLMVPECLYDLRKGSLKQALTEFTPKVREIAADSPEYLETCGSCPLINICMWCPAIAYLEAGRMDRPVDDFCALARERSNMLGPACGNTLP
jgi:radical SAM protein with 4Fe4S-binding SPASM domain